MPTYLIAYTSDCYERTSEHRDYANGFKPKTVKTRLEAITFDIPQVRGGGFYPSALEKGMRSERALYLALAEMYVQGVSTRKVSEIVQRLFGVEVSSAQVSKAAAYMDEVLAHVPSKATQKEGAAQIWAIFQAPNRATAERYLAEAIRRVPKVSIETGRLDGDQSAGGADRVRLSQGALASYSDHQHGGVPASGDASRHARGGHLSQ